MTVLLFIVPVHYGCPFVTSSHKNVSPLLIVKSEFLGSNAFNCQGDEPKYVPNLLRFLLFPPLKSLLDYVEPRFNFFLPRASHTGEGDADGHVRQHAEIMSQ